MASTVKTRPNHYETLGLTPAASQAEIDRAFARELGLSQMRAFGGTAAVSIAYGVLRDPIKRRAYDESIGVNASPPPVQPRHRYSLSIPAIHVDPPKRPEQNSEARMASFIASSLREPVSQEPQHDIAPPEPPAPPEPAKPSFVAREEPRPVSARPLPRFLEDDRKVVDEQPVDWRRTAGIAGAVVAAVGLMGAWAGWEAGNEVEAEDTAPTNQAVTVALPKAKPATFASLTDAVPPARAQRRSRAAVVNRSVEGAPLSIEIAQAEQPTPTAAPRNPPEVNPAEEAYTEATPDAPVEATPASLPLSHATIARTIGRIGYPCGRVASTSQVLGKVFKVTCTSGDSYRAAPIHGRYRFKRL